MLPDPELYYLRSENVESDHEIHSEFYNAQIESVFADASPQRKCYGVRMELNEFIRTSAGFELFVLPAEVDKVIENLQRPIFWTDRHVGPVVESLNRVFVESINVKALKSDLAARKLTIDFKSFASLKTLDLWLKERFGFTDTAALLCPFFVLYDFRVLTSHLQPAANKQVILTSIITRLGLPANTGDNQVIYDALISQMLTSLAELRSRIIGT